MRHGISTIFQYFLRQAKGSGWEYRQAFSSTAGKLTWSFRFLEMHNFSHTWANLMCFGSWECRACLRYILHDHTLRDTIFPQAQSEKNTPLCLVRI